MRREPPEAHEALGEQRVHEREEEERVGAGTDEVVLVGLVGRPRAARVDDHDLAAALRGSRAGAPGTSGAVMRLPFETSGFAPRMSR